MPGRTVIVGRVQIKVDQEVRRPIPEHFVRVTEFRVGRNVVRIAWNVLVLVANFAAVLSSKFRLNPPRHEVPHSFVKSEFPSNDVLINFVLPSVIPRRWIWREHVLIEDLAKLVADIFVVDGGVNEVGPEDSMLVSKLILHGLLRLQIRVASPLHPRVHERMRQKTVAIGVAGCVVCVPVIEVNLTFRRHWM